MKCLPLVLAMLIAAPAFAADPAADFFVATNGNDNWSGKIAAPNADRTDGPLATLTKAQEAARMMHGVGKALQGAPVLGAPEAGAVVRILVRGGEYVLEKPLSFGWADSNTTVAAYEDGRAVF